MKFKNKKQRMIRNHNKYIIETARMVSERDRCQVVVLERDGGVIYTSNIDTAHNLIDDEWSIFCIFQDGKVCKNER